YRPNGQHRVVASFSSCSNGRVVDSIGSILGTNFAHQASYSSYLCSTPCNTSLKRAVQNNGASSNILCVRDNGSRSLNDQTRMTLEQYNIYDNTHLSLGSEACVPWMHNSSLSALGSSRKSNFMDKFNCESPVLLDCAGMASVLGLGASKRSRNIHEFPESVLEAHDLLQGQSFQDTQFSNNHHHVLQKEDNFGQPKVLTEKNAVGPSQQNSKLIDFAQVNSNVAKTHEKSPTSSSKLGLEKLINFLFLYEHVLSCSLRERECDVHLCPNFKEKLNHILNCNVKGCEKSCYGPRVLIDHYRKCRSIECQLCGPVWRKLAEVSDQLRPAKRCRTESCSAFLSGQNETFKEPRPAPNSNGSSSQGSSRTFQRTLMSTNVSSEIQDVSMNQKFLDSSTSKVDDWNVNLVRLEETKVQREQEKTKMQNEVDDVAVEMQENAEIQNKDSDFAVRMQEDPHIKDEDGNIVLKLQEKTKNQNETGVRVVVEMQENSQIQNEGSDFVPNTECKPDSLQVVTPVVIESNLVNPRIEVVSLIDTFTAEKIREHLKSLKQCSGQVLKLEVPLPEKRMFKDGTPGHAKSGQSQ
ncbi:Histone acetyltransferase HAC4, partial [Ananas comosus]